MGRRHSPFKKILIGFDGSQQSEKATEIGLVLPNRSIRGSAFCGCAIPRRQQWSNGAPCSMMRENTSKRSSRTPLQEMVPRVSQPDREFF